MALAPFPPTPCSLEATIPSLESGWERRAAYESMNWHLWSLGWQDDKISCGHMTRKELGSPMMRLDPDSLTHTGLVLSFQSYLHGSVWVYILYLAFPWLDRQAWTYPTVRLWAQSPQVRATPFFVLVFFSFVITTLSPSPPTIMMM